MALQIQCHRASLLADKPLRHHPRAVGGKVRRRRGTIILVVAAMIRPVRLGRISEIIHEVRVLLAIMMTTVTVPELAAIILPVLLDDHQIATEIILVHTRAPYHREIIIRHAVIIRQHVPGTATVKLRLVITITLRYSRICRHSRHCRRHPGPVMLAIIVGNNLFNCCSTFNSDTFSKLQSD